MREEAFVVLGAGLDQVAQRAGQRSPAVDALHRVDPAGAHLTTVIEERRAGTRIAVTPHLPRTTELVRLRRAAVGDDLAHRNGDRIADLHTRVVGAAGHWPALARVQAATQRHLQFDAVEEAFVLRDRRVDEAGQLRDGVSSRVAERRPRRDVRSFVGTLEVDHQPLASHGDCDVDVDVLVARRVGVDVHVSLVGAVGPLRDFGPQSTTGVGDRPLDRVLHRLRTEPVDDLLQTRRTQLRGADLGAQVADEAGKSIVRPHREHHVAALAARIKDLQQGVTRALAPDVLGEDVVAASHRTTGVAVVALDRGEQQEFPGIGEDGAEHVEVGQVATPVVGVVGHEDIAGVQVAVEELAGEADRQRGGEHELGNADGQRCEAPVAGEDGGIALVRLIQDRRGGGARHIGGHLETDRLHRRQHDGGRDRIDRDRVAQRPV
ncbi:unannotated protein [freshwater metagenome]|uniref:Unannotated protein n=1 Tax=freshwater metagenome TaxID=449393 RepID=A0A6J6ZAX6_9ZZZZ